MPEVFKGRKGDYKIISTGKDSLVVKYLSGPWKNREVSMSKATHERMQENITIESKVPIVHKLDLWWDLFPSLYEENWYEGIESFKLLSTLELKYPEQAETIHQISIGIKED